MSRRWSQDKINELRELRYVDGWTYGQCQEYFGCSDSVIRRYAPSRPGKIDNARLREAFLGSGLSAGEVARRVGWFNGGHGHGDSSRLRRSLGLRPDISDAGIRTTRKMIDAETAAMIAEAIGIAPWEVGCND